MYEYLSNCVEFINFVYYMNKNYVFAFVFTLVEILSAPPSGAFTRSHEICISVIICTLYSVYDLCFYHKNELSGLKLTFVNYLSKI